MVTGILDISEMRLLTPSELAAMIALWRKDRGWTQETLAEIAGITARTLQRVESGQGGSADTRRALARALECLDIDVFNKPWPIPDMEKIKQEADRINRETVEVAIQPLPTGRAVREFGELSNASGFHQFGPMSEEAEHVFAELQDYFRDYGDVDDCYSATQKLDVDRDFQRMVDDLKAAGFALGGGSRRVRLVDRQPTDAEPLRFTIVYIVVAPVDALPTSIRAPRSAQFSF
jgi:transcriptional regulator with XRE-family HTH domain